MGPLGLFSQQLSQQLQQEQDQRVYQVHQQKAHNAEYNVCELHAAGAGDVLAVLGDTVALEAMQRQ